MRVVLLVLCSCAIFSLAESIKIAASPTKTVRMTCVFSENTKTDFLAIEEITEPHGLNTTYDIYTWSEKLMSIRELNMKRPLKLMPAVGGVFCKFSSENDYVFSCSKAVAVERGQPKKEQVVLHSYFQMNSTFNSNVEQSTIDMLIVCNGSHMKDNQICNIEKPLNGRLKGGDIDRVLGNKETKAYCKREDYVGLN